MRLLVWNDGQVIEASQLRLDKPYVMQRIHTIGHKVYNIARHIEQLREASMSLFGFATLCGPADAERIITKLLELSRVTPRLSCPVAMRLDCDGALSFEVEEPLYDMGMEIKAKRVTGVGVGALTFDNFYLSSATIAVDELAQAMASKRGGNISIYVNSEGNIVSQSWRPIFVVYNGRVYTPSAFSSVEYSVVKDAVESIGLELIVRDIPYESLQRVDEVFFADTMAVTSLFAVEKYRLLSVVTSRITSRMEPTI
jgi:branched-subunit amino acid aminotransferase/4-amino-4-deoxychorismate lyase